MKRLKFAEPLPDLILQGKKTTTWRINDDKALVKGDKLSLCYTNGEQFALAIVLSTHEKSFEHLDEKDLEGHEQFPSKEAMYATYSRYYGFSITPSTQVKIIRFSLL